MHTGSCPCAGKATSSRGWRDAMTLFRKIFLGFWLTVVVIAATSFQVAGLLHRDEDLALQGKLATEFDQWQGALRQDGSLALVVQNDTVPDAPEELVIATDDNQLLWPTSAGSYTRQLLTQINNANPTLKDIHQHMLSVGILVHADNGEALKLLARQPLLPAREPLLYLAIALLVSGMICGLLTRTLVTPLRRLSDAAGKLAEGELSARADTGVPRFGRDELFQLSRDFDHMAGRLQQLIASQKQLLHDVSHELRTPLTRIRLAVELARGSAAPDVERSLQRIDRECEELVRLVDELLSLPQLDAQHAALDEQVDLTALVADRVTAAQLEADAAGKHLRFDPGTDNRACIVTGRADWLARLIDNLVGNALRYTPVGTAVTVRLGEEGANLLLSVQDEGSGVPDSELERIFEPFVRVDAAREKQGRGGYGLGLALVKKITQLHRGEVRAQNTHPGFRVDVKLRRT